MKKILTIDGGGIKGIFSAVFLAELEEKCDGSICDYFDLIAGTSTGAIIAAALCIGIPAKDIADLYMENAENIFPLRRKYKIFRGKYDSEPLKKALTNTFGEKQVKDCKTRLLIPVFNLTTRKVQVFKTPHAEDLLYDKDELLVDILMATTAAPIFFSPYKMKRGVYMDGGVGANNPSMLAFVEGLTRCGWNRNEMRMLSVGSVEEPHPVRGTEKMGLKDALKIQKSFMLAECQYADNGSRLLLGEKNYIRVKEEILKGQAGLDKVDTESLKVLKAQGMNAAQTYTERIKSNFFNEKKDLVQFYNI